MASDGLDILARARYKEKFVTIYDNNNNNNFIKV